MGNITLIPHRKLKFRNHTLDEINMCFLSACIKRGVLQFIFIFRTLKKYIDLSSMCDE